MASTLSRVTDFIPATPILSGEVDSEFNQIVNLLNGTSTNIKATLDVSDSGDPPLELNQLSTGPILKGLQGGVENFRIRNNGGVRTPGIYDTNDNEQLLFSLTASAVNEFTIKNAATGNPPEFRATGGDGNISIKLVPFGTGVVKIQSGLPVANEDAANKLYVDNTTVAFSCTVGTEADPNTTPGVTESGRFSAFIPDGNAMTITKLKIKFQEGSHTAGAGNVLSYTVRVRNAAGATTADLGPISLNDTNNTIHVTYTLDVTDTPLTAGDSVTFFKSTLTGTITERAVSIGFVGTQKRI